MLLPLLIFMPSAFQGGEFPDNGKNHWAYEGVAYMKSTGILVGYPDGLGYRRFGMSRYEFAVIYNAGAAHSKAMLEGSAEAAVQIAAVKQNEQVPASSSFLRIQEMQSNPVVPMALKDMERAATEFAPELSALGVKPERVRYEVQRFRRWLATYKVPTQGSALQRFPDVPANHWAAAAVAHLREEGILHGYPDEKYRG